MIVYNNDNDNDNDNDNENDNDNDNDHNLWVIYNSGSMINSWCACSMNL